jgi:hypothetical protein
VRRTKVLPTSTRKNIEKRHGQLRSNRVPSGQLRVRSGNLGARRAGSLALYAELRGQSFPMNISQALLPVVYVHVPRISHYYRMYERFSI